MNTQKTKGDILAERIEEILKLHHYADDKIRAALADYRKPEWTLGHSVNGFTLRKGEQWHRDDFTEDMLPEGWRPCILGERIESSDQHYLGRKWNAGGTNKTAEDLTFHTRTRRPLPVLTPAQIADGWIEWHGGECPVWKGSKPTVMFKDKSKSCTYEATHWIWTHTEDDYDIIAYRPDPYEALKKAHSEGKVIQMLDADIWVDWELPQWNFPVEEYRVKPAPVMVPLSPEDVTCGDEIKAIEGNQNRLAISEVSPLGVYTRHTETTWLELQSHCLINRHDGKGFVRCEKPEGGK